MRGHWGLAKKTRNREHDAGDPPDQASKQRKLAQEKKHATRPCVTVLYKCKSSGRYIGTEVALFLVVVPGALSIQPIHLGGKRKPAIGHFFIPPL